MDVYKDMLLPILLHKVLHKFINALFFHHFRRISIGEQVPREPSVAVRDAFSATTFQFFVHLEFRFVKHFFPLENTGIVTFLDFYFVFNFFFAFFWYLDFLHKA